nr:PD-(D/E)XK nuclease family protein [Desulfobacula sp.]
MVKKHIILENKLYARDQEGQIKNYIKKIYSENKKLDHERLYILYLSIGRDKPSEYSLGDLNIK